jgi:hypothetical protein
VSVEGKNKIVCLYDATTAIIEEMRRVCQVIFAWYYHCFKFSLSWNMKLGNCHRSFVSIRGRKSVGGPLFFFTLVDVETRAR